MKTIKRVAYSACALAVLGLAALEAQAPATTPPSGRRVRVAVLDFDYATVYSGVSSIFGQNVDVLAGHLDRGVAHQRADLRDFGLVCHVRSASLKEILARQ